MCFISIVHKDVHHINNSVYFEQCHISCAVINCIIILSQMAVKLLIVTKEAVKMYQKQRRGVNVTLDGLGSSVTQVCVGHLFSQLFADHHSSLNFPLTLHPRFLSTHLESRLHHCFNWHFEKCKKKMTLHWWFEKNSIIHFRVLKNANKEGFRIHKLFFLTCVILVSYSRNMWSLF